MATTQANPPSTGPAERRDRRSPWPLRLLVLVTAAIYAQTATFHFVHYDDPHYFYGPPQVWQGVNPQTLRWAVTNTEGKYWHPVSSLVHLVACTIFPIQPGAQHLVTVAIFIGAVAVLFWVLRAATGSAAVAFFAVALWAWHPMRVESVAWLTERGAVIAALFMALALRAYVRYARRPGVGRYGLVALCFTLAMLSKPTLLALPLGLLALDLWPLGRLQARWRERRWRGAFALVLEKIPLLMIALAIALLTLKLSAEAAESELARSLTPARRATALVAGYGWGMAKTLVPTDLAVHHPWSNAWPLSHAIISSFVLVGVTALVLWSRRPPLVAGWFWFVVMLLPMLVGSGLRTSWVAGRYMLVPHVLLFAGLAASVPRTRAAAWAAWVVLLAAAVGSALELRHWRDSQALFARALAVTHDNAIVHYNLGVALHAQGRHREAAEQFRHAVRIDPRYLSAHVNLGAMLQLLGDFDGAERHYRAALDIAPDPTAQENLAALAAERAKRGAATAPSSAPAPTAPASNTSVPAAPPATSP